MSGLPDTGAKGAQVGSADLRGRVSKDEADHALAKVISLRPRVGWRSFCSALASI